MRKKSLSPEDALGRLQHLCSSKEYCKYDLLQKLHQWGIEEGTSIIKRLEEDNFLNEQRYANAYVNDKWKFGKWGRQKIAYMLRGKQVPDKYIREALENVDEEAYREMVLSEVSKKKKSLKEDDPYKLKQKLFRFAQSRGYELDIVGSGG